VGKPIFGKVIIGRKPNRSKYALNTKDMLKYIGTKQNQQKKRIMER
jgi:hypothetical protein